MGAPNIDLFKFMADTFNIDNFIETGSAHGETALKATSIFKNIHTIELSKALFNETHTKLGDKAVCHFGKSIDILKLILPSIKGSVFYWLDAHWSSGPTAGEKNQCPLLKEIDEINKRPGNDDFLFIDDAHLFFSPAALVSPYYKLNRKQWPNINDIFKLLNKKDRYTTILFSWRCIKHGAPQGIVLPEDVIISVPKHAKDKVFKKFCTLTLEGN